MRARSLRYLGAILLSTSLLPPAAGTPAAPDALTNGFRQPPHVARPWVWWHWMNGNISAKGVRLDLQWMKRAGIGGTQLFEGGLGAPQVVPERLTYMSAPWKAALRASVEESRRLGLDLGIATSPGWSASGGPWVAPGDAMKKLVWTSQSVQRGGHQPIRLMLPSDVAGPYQDIPISAVEAGAGDGPHLYRDARILAWPAPPGDRLPAPKISASNPDEPVADLGDGGWSTPMMIAPAKGQTDGWVLYDFGRPVTLRSIRAGIPEHTGFGAPKATVAALESSTDGVHFQLVTALSPTASPVRSASFSATTARWFRLRLWADTKPGFTEALTFAPGAIRPSFGPPPASFFPISEIVLSGISIIDHAEEKAGFATVPDYYAIPTAPASGIDPTSVIDLTGKLRADGTLDWMPPPGDWTVLRLGWSLTGHRNGPAPDEATGLEVDKLDPARVAAYADHYLALYRDALGQDDFASLRGLLSDSIEAGAQTWTEGLPAAFRRLRGYDPTPWLPALSGRIVKDAASSDRFLWDWRRTIGDLYASAHYAGLAKAAHGAGLRYYAEALEDHRPQLGDDLAMRAPADVPMGAMWTLDPGTAPKPTYIADLKGAASVADLYGKPLVAAESLTAFGHPFAYAPADLKRTVDLEFALGVNRVMIHTSPHQPLTDSAPGVTMAPFLGQYFSRNETWAELASGWTDYIARSSYLLQQGHKVADIAYFAGEEAPLTSLFGDKPIIGIPAGRDYDFVDADALRTQLRVADGELLAPSGTRYRLLLLGGSSRRMTLATLRRLHDLVAAGATLVGDRPIGSPSLADDDQAVSAATDALWGATATPVRDVGKGHVYAAAVIDKALAGIAPDWSWSLQAGDAAPAVIHRAAHGLDLYFLSNQSSRPMSGFVRLRVMGRVPEMWHADSGRSEPVSFTIANGAITIPLALPTDGSVFIVFRKPATATRVTVSDPSYATLRTLDGSWSVSFQPGRGAPAGEVETGLIPWNDNNNPGIRYFSGVGTYRTSLTLDAVEVRRLLSLDLGRVGDVARVTVNGRSAGIVWKAPYRLDVSGLLHAGRNDIRVEVANLWVNRLIGDAQPGATTIAHTAGPTYAADAPLRFSGLAGPVTLITRTSAKETYRP